MNGLSRVRTRTDKDEDDRKHETSLSLADSLKEHFGEANPCQDNGFWSDLMGAALSEVNWYEIAHGMIYELAEEETEEA